MTLLYDSSTVFHISSFRLRDRTQDSFKYLRRSQKRCGLEVVSILLQISNSTNLLFQVLRDFSSSSKYGVSIMFHRFFQLSGKVYIFFQLFLILFISLSCRFERQNYYNKKRKIQKRKKIKKTKQKDTRKKGGKTIRKEE